MTTSAPRAASSMAFRRPIPRLEPVTRAVFPSRRYVAVPEDMIAVLGIYFAGSVYVRERGMWLD